MNVKVIGIVVGIVVTGLLLGTVMVFMLGGGEPTLKEDIQTMDEIVEETIHFEPTPEVMVADEGVVYWPVSGPSNSTDIILVTGVQARISWSDDETAPSYRAMYQNEPDTMTLEVHFIPFLEGISNENNSSNINGTSMTGRSDMGSTRLDLDLTNNPILLEEGPDTNLSFIPEGVSEKGNSGLYISISCIAGDITASRPALLMYTDRGDEVTLTLSVTIKRVPVDTFEAWVEEQTRSSDW